MHSATCGNCTHTFRLFEIVARLPFFCFAFQPRSRGETSQAPGADAVAS